MVRRKEAKKKNMAKKGIVKYFLSQPDQENVSFKYSAMPNSPQSTKDEARRIADFIGIGHCTIGVALKEMVAEGYIDARKDSNNNAYLYSLTDKCKDLIQEVQMENPMELPTAQPIQEPDRFEPVMAVAETQANYAMEEVPDFWDSFFSQFYQGLTGMIIETFRFTLEEDRNCRREIFEKIINRFQKELQEKEQELDYLTGKFNQLKTHKEQLTETEAKRFKNRIAELEGQLELANRRIGELNKRVSQNKPNVEWVQKYTEEMGKNLKVTLGDMIKKAGPEGSANMEAMF